MFSRIPRSVASGVQRPEGSRRTIDRGRSGKISIVFYKRYVRALLPSNNKLRTGVALKKKEDPAGSLTFTDFLHPSIIVRNFPFPFVSFARIRARIVGGGLGARVLCAGICLCYEMQSNLRVYVTLPRLALRFYTARAA